MQNFLDLIKSRNFLAQIAHPEEFSSHLSEKRRLAYVGFDPTAESLHVGNLMPIMALRRWQQSGHKAVVLMGGATAMIGDPSGKTELRQMITEETIDFRIGLFQKQFHRFLNMSPEHCTVVNNASWFRGMGYLSILREIGADFTVNRMLAAECFKQRYEKGLSFLEFNYMILQSYDFLHLNRTLGVTVQMGGDDQWSNMIGGMDLIRRKERQQAFIVTNPLLTTTAGAKMGKTEKGAVWLNPDMTSPFELFQYFRNVDDDMVEKCLFYFTDLPVEDVRHLGGLQGAAINEAKVVLAFELTKLIHGDEEAERSKTRAANLFSQSQSGGDDAPEVFIDRNNFANEMSILDVLVLAKICDSKGEARRLVDQGGIAVAETKVSDPKFMVAKSIFEDGSSLVVKKGKKNFYKLKLK
ncbi:MAG: tyrosine--tRNA ligase [Proteobacteria bacterium]|nr:tyrosine--tRNA ligase [Pseudomonadota bacterium]